MNKTPIISLFALACLVPAATREPIVRTVDLNIGESAEVQLADGSTAHLKLIDLVEKADTLRGAIRSAAVTVEVNGRTERLPSGNYNLPRTVAGVQIDCPITKGYLANSNRDAWALEKDVRLRLWPARSPLIAPGTFVYPLKQRWFATYTQMANEPTYVNGNEQPRIKQIYYHNDLDFGGAEGMVDVVAATDGLVVSSGLETHPKHREDTPVRPRYDVVYLLDERGWYYRYSHLLTIDDAIQPGARVKMGQKIGVLGKEGGSGGWSHLHFGVVSRQPSGRWGTQEAYAFAWEAYQRQYKPAIIAVARPHHFVAVGEKVTLDASKSWSAAGRIVSYQWEFTDGVMATATTVERTYNKPGMYSEILRVEDERGNVAYDFAVVQVADTEKVDEPPPAIHPAYAPTTGIQTGDRVTFKVRTFNTTDGEEVWEFGDGTPPVKVKSDGNVEKLAKDGYAVTEHSFAKPGTYVVRVQRTNKRGETAVGHVAVQVKTRVELDAFGGWTDIKGQATGTFHIETINGRYLLITPAGHGFVALGVNHLSAIRANGPNEPNLFSMRYQEDWKKFSQDVLGQYDDWGLNTVDGTVTELRTARPYLAANNFVRTAKYYGKPGENNPYDFPDVFDPDVKERLERDVAAFCKQHRDNKNLIAYYWTDTPTWDIHKTRRFRGTDWVSEIRRLPAQSPGRIRYVEFLRERYGNDLARFRRAYDTTVQSFNELREIDLSNLDLTSYEIERDDQEFLGLIARTYYGIVGLAMRRHDPRHMVFGEKYLLGDNPRQVIEAAAPHLDAIAIQPGDGYIRIYTPGDIYPDEEIEALHRISGKPIFICDHQISFATARYPVAIWPYHQRPNEADAAAATERFLLEAFARPYILGYMRCQYIDRFTERRNAIKLGLLRDDGSPYTHLVDATRSANQAVKEMVRQAVLPHSAPNTNGLP